MGRFGTPYWQQANGRTQWVSGAPYRCLSPNNIYSLKTSADKAWRFETHPGDCLSYETDRTRSEIVDIVHATIAYGTTYWRAWDFKVSVSPSPLAPAVSGGWLLFGQLHQTAGTHDVAGASPPISFNMQASGEMSVCTNGSTQNPLVNLHTSVVRAVTSGFTQNAWHRTVIEYNLDPVNGSLNWWLDGTQICALTGIQVGYASDQGPYDQFGIYTGPVGVEMSVVAEYCNVVASTTTSLASMIGPASPPFALI